ncbi:Phage protein Gp37/Gp68 [Maioricimonas rarisocia]|uniref:Phage protein Gp37/Gp68 n=1 Tax=Maioricimonas rarisocia TaxID=2528026 RepID=A0A517Z167_9PLAN|nr:DUF5131 family protein [Maioricimonas rarisocia]QDU36232.1 Phage protein Gp37/Gp68 [Maioricimonas rarisocia]
MSASTKIQWCDSTCNPTMGCDGCELWTAKVKKCYAGTLHVRFGGASKGYAPSFEEVTRFPGRMEQATRWRDLSGTSRVKKPWLDGYPRLIFVSDMSDAMSDGVSFEFLQGEVIDCVASDGGRNHQWLWLTKRPNRMAEFSNWLALQGICWPSNLWAGTSVTSQRTTSRIEHLLRVGDENTIRFLSVEPQYEQVDLGKWLPHLNWVIQGGESGRGAARFELEWARLLIAQCREHGVPYFLKQLGASVTSDGMSLRFEDGHAGNWDEWPDDLRVRELPTLPKVGSGVAESLARKPTDTAFSAWETGCRNA